MNKQVSEMVEVSVVFVVDPTVNCFVVVTSEVVSEISVLIPVRTSKIL